MNRQSSSAPDEQAYARPDAPFLDPGFAPVEIDVRTAADGTILMSNRLPLGPLPVRQLGDYLRRHAAERPQHVFLAERDAARQWRRLSYAQARQQADALSQYLLDQGLDGSRPVMILSENSIHHALLQLAAMQVGIPVMPVSAAYSLMSKTCGKVSELAQRFQPALIYADDAKRYAKALEVAKNAVPDLKTISNQGTGLSDFSFTEICQTRPTSAVEAAYAAVGPDTTARLLLTSGSTGTPKAVIMTQSNILSSGVLWDTVWPFLAEEPLVLVDWLPWNHTAGSHGPFAMALRHGGTLYLDDGKPIPELISRTLSNLREIRPSLMVNVPRGLDMLVAQMEDDPASAAEVFANLRVIVYGGAALSPQTLVRLEQLSVQATGRRVPVSSSLGSTETTMPATLIWWPPKTLGTLGLPAPGVEAKLVPQEGRYEVRFRGPNITPGYHGDAQATAQAFDEEGFLKTGDVVTFADPHDITQGLLYAGRLSDNFKLSSGTWVSVAKVREALLEQLAPLIQDVVLAEPNRPELGALCFPNLARIRKLYPELADASSDAACRHPALLNELQQRIQRYNEAFPGSSTRIARAILLETPPNIDIGEITDKGHINQRAVLRSRADLVLRLYADDDAQAPRLRF